MAATIVNDPNNLPPVIWVKTLKEFNSIGISEKFLDIVTKHPTENIGIKRNNYYIIKCNVLIRYHELTRELQIFAKILEICINLGFKMIQIKF